MLEPKIFTREEAAAIKPGTVVLRCDGSTGTVGSRRCPGYWRDDTWHSYTMTDGGSCRAVHFGYGNFILGVEIADILADSPWIPMADAEPMPDQAVVLRPLGDSAIYINAAWEDWYNAEWLPVDELPQAMRVYLGVEC